MQCKQRTFFSVFYTDKSAVFFTQSSTPVYACHEAVIVPLARLPNACVITVRAFWVGRVLANYVPVKFLDHVSKFAHRLRRVRWEILQAGLLFAVSCRIICRHCVSRRSVVLLLDTTPDDQPAVI